MNRTFIAIVQVFVTVLLTSLFSLASRADGVACNWNSEIFKTKISDACQTEFMGKVTDEQDKIFSRRMFKDWNMPTGTEVYTEPGVLQVTNENNDSLFQVVWLSKTPSIMWIDGVIVSDASTDTSVYRRLERMIKKADEAKTAKRDPVRTFLFGNEAYAAPANGPYMPLAYLYTVNGYTGTAEEILNNTDRSIDGVVDYRSRWSWFNNIPHTCDGDKIGTEKPTIDGKELTIRQVSKNQFEITGLITDSVVKVDMLSQATGERAMVKTKKGKRIYVPVEACQGIASSRLNDTCKDAWTDYVAKNPDIKDKFDRIVEKNGSDTNYSSDIRCRDLYTDKEDKQTCLGFFGMRVPKTGHRYSESSAVFSVCNENGRNCRQQKSDIDILAKEDPDYKTKISDMGGDVKVIAREAYRSALKAAGVKNVDEVCPVPNLGTSISDAGSCDPYPLSSPVSGKTKNARYSQRLKIKEAYQEVKDPEGAAAKEMGGTHNQELEKRLLGMMILGDCCSDPNQGCRDRVKQSRGLDLNSKSGTSTR